ncbi:dynamin family protein [Roseibacterium sp. SDUM158016]|uniref:dynamin family protein n=1 Tax=Roseicyclus sediminis TaxID=2980997 RepID=UPI0021CE9557|nr:dynamin family protein [Roseibacterium sp. SDUM158016]MCU4652779.1 dynamin family protein [Roseibacterium sp. SDUM158016]
MMHDAFPAMDGGRRPRIAILGEFSSGKSTLTNVLLGHVSSPVRVTATQVPPIWYCQGDSDPVVVDSEGEETEIDAEAIASVPIAGTRYVRVFLPADILAGVDLIDMPGSSDPNMSADIWNAVLPEADAVIWCTPATQAWRQSEAAIWDGIDPEIQARSILLVTRIDKVLSEHDRARLLKRVRRETSGLFRDIFTVDLLSAQNGTEAQNGIEAVRAALETLRTGLSGAAPADEPDPSDDRRSGEATVLRLEDHAPAARGVSIVPRRVTMGGVTAARRPRRTTGSAGSAL